MNAMTTIAAPWRLRGIGGGHRRISEDVLVKFASARGCSETTQAAEFLAPDISKVEIRNSFSQLRDFPRAAERVFRAIEKKERISLFSDYDTDGVTSVVEMRDFLLAAGHPNEKLRIFIPDRFEQDYGLTLKAIKSVVEIHQPQLMIITDCGSNSFDSLAILRTAGVDTIVLDHHDVHAPPGGVHPATAHLNPKGDAPFGSHGEHAELCRLCAAGLAFMFCDALAKLRPCATWDRDRALILAGLGTLVDVMPLVGVNRVLVRKSLQLINRPEIRARVPGLGAMREVFGIQITTPYSYGFQIGPALNASGRMAHARKAVQLLAASNIAEAWPLAQELVTANKTRKAVQQSILTEAIDAADQTLLDEPATKLLMLCAPHWHQGIVGIVAGRIRELYSRPVIVCGQNDAGYWKGSGRSVPGFDLGGLVGEAFKAGLITSGGGHAAAAGLKYTREQRAHFEAWLRHRMAGVTLDTTPEYDILGHADEFSVPTWVTILDRLEPFGAGNPKPFFLVESARLADDQGTKLARADGAGCGTSLTFFHPSMGAFTAKMFNLRRLGTLQHGMTYNLILDLVTRRGGPEWTVQDVASVD